MSPKRAFSFVGNVDSHVHIMLMETVFGGCQVS
jgi:hypothetical protein